MSGRPPLSRFATWLGAFTLTAGLTATCMAASQVVRQPFVDGSKPEARAKEGASPPSLALQTSTDTSRQIKIDGPLDSAAQSNPVDQIGDFITPERVSGTLATVITFAVLSLAPALLLMTTCFVRIGIVLTLLRQAIGTQGVPSNQVLAALAMFMTAAIMSPVWKEIHQNAIVPYRSEEIPWEDALARAMSPLHEFMARQIERTGNADDVWMFLERSGQDTSTVNSYDEVPFQVLAPAFLLSELKTAFLIGFQIYLPFLVIDLAVASVIAGMGLITVPPVLVSLPAKLLLFVLVDGWHLIVGMLLDSFA